MSFYGTKSKPYGIAPLNNLGKIPATLLADIDSLSIADGSVSNSLFQLIPNLAGVSGNIQAQIDAIAAGGSFIGGYDASSNLFPATGGSGPAGAIQKGDQWSISVQGTLGGTVARQGALLIALFNNPGQTSSNWNISQTGLTSFNGRTGPAILPEANDYDVAQVTGAAPLDSPDFTGTPTAPMPAASDSSTKLATTASILAKTLAGLTQEEGQLEEIDTILSAFSKLSYAPSFVAARILSNGDTIVLGTAPNQVSFYIGGVTGMGNRVTFPGGGDVISTSIIGDDSPILGSALSNIGTDGVQNYIAITNQLLTGLSIVNAPIIDTDSILGGLGKAQGQIDTLAPLDSPDFTGTPTAPTQSQGDNSDNLATTEYVDTGLASLGTVTTVSVAPANGFSGTVTNPTTTPEISIKTSVIGILKGDGTIVSAAIDTDIPITNALSSSTNTMESNVNGEASSTSIINSNALDLVTTSLTSTVNGVPSSTVQVTPSGQSISSSISFTNLDERILLVAPSVNAIGTYILQLKGINQELNIVFSINGNATSFYNNSAINIIQVSDTTGNITTSNISNFILLRGYVRNNTPNSYFAVIFSMPQQLIYTNPLTMTIWQSGASYLNENPTLTSLITGDISALITIAPPDLIFKMKVNVIPVSSSIPQGYVYLPGSSSSAIFQYSLNQTTGILTTLVPVSVPMPNVYKLTATALRNYVYAINNSNIFMFRVNPITGTLGALAPASITTTNTPTGIAIDPTDRFLYVCGFGSGVFGQHSITKSTGQLTVIPGAPVAASGMQDLAIHPSGKFLYAINNINGFVYQYSINTSTGALTALGPPPIPAGTGPVKIAIHPSGLYAYVLNNGSANISQYSINTSTGALTALTPATFTVGANPFGLAISNNGLFIYYSSQGSNTISVSAINSTGLIGATISSQAVTGARVFCFDFSGNYLFVVNNTANQLFRFVVNQTTGAMTANGNMPTGTNANNIIAI